MKQNIHLSDIKVILHLFAPKEYNLFIFDPEGRLIEDVQENASDTKSTDILINLGDEIQSLRGRQLEEFDMIFDFGFSRNNTHKHSYAYRTINNPDGTVRWMYPVGKGKSVLNFYSASTLKAKLNVFALKTLFTLKLDRFISKKINFKSNTIPKCESLFKAVDFDYASYFLGTPGINRTPVAALIKKDKPAHFAKMAMSAESYQAFQNERKSLYRLMHHPKTKFISPEVSDVHENAILMTSNIKPKFAKRTSKMEEAHYAALVNLYNISKASISLERTAFWDNIVQNIGLIQDNNQLIANASQLKQLLKSIKNGINKTSPITTTFAHGDFTPWNCYLRRNTLHLYDWELSKKAAPALYDLFHFHFQTGIFLKNQSFEQILKNIFQSIQAPTIQNIIVRHNIDLTKHILLYLLRIVSYSIAKYQKENIVTADNKKQIVVWTSALETLHKKVRYRTERKVFILDFNERLQNTRHAYLKFNAPGLKNLNVTSDLDIMVQKADIKRIIEFCKNHAFVQRIRVNKQSFMTTVNLFFFDGSFLSLDLLHTLKRKNLVMTQSHPFLVSSRLNKKNIMVPHLKYDLEYTVLFYKLNGADIPLKYLKHFSAYPQTEIKQALSYLQNRYKLQAESIGDLVPFESKQQEQLRAALRKFGQNRGLRYLRNSLDYLYDTIRNMFQNRGIIISFSGVDGAGKTTVIEHVTALIEKHYRKEVVYLRHRPGILPILSTIKHGSKEKAENVASETMPRTGSNRNKLSSLLRFSYYYTDYLIGQVYVYFKYIMRGKVVLFDRYYFDFINDGKRSNIQLNPKIIRWLYRFILKPKLNFFLYADTHIILKRKQELSAHDVETLSKRYKQLFERLGKNSKNQYIPIRNIQLDKTLDTVIRAYSNVA